MKPKHNNPFVARLRRGKFIAGVSSILLTGNAFAGTLYWDNNGATAGAATSNATWLTNAWTTNSAGTTTPNVAWVNGETAVFAAGTTWASGNSTTITVGSVTTPSIIFEEAPTGGTARNRTLSGGTITIGGGTINSSSWGTGASGNHGHDVVISSVLAGSGGLTIAAHGNATDDGGGGGGSEFRLNANNTFTGGLTITSGVVSWRNDAHFGPASNVVTLNGGGIVYTDQASFSTPASRAFQVGSAGGTIRLYGDKTVTINGPISNATGVAATTLRRTDGGTLRLLASNLSGFHGTFHNGGGTTQVFSPGFNFDDDTVRINGGGLQLLNGGTATVGALEMNGGELSLNNGTTLVPSTSAFTLNGGTIKSHVAPAGTIMSPTGTLTLTAGNPTGDLTGGGNVEVVITDSGVTPVAFVKNNNGNLTLARTNTFSGGTTINGGRIEAKNGAFGTGAVLVNDGGEAWLRGNLPFANSFTINGNGPSEGGNNYGALRFNTPADVSGPVNIASASRITAYGINDSGTISGPITGTAALEKTGDGDITLSGSNGGFSGLLSVNAGTLKLSSPLPGSVTVGNGATITGESTVGGTLTLSGIPFILADGSTSGALAANNLTVDGVVMVKVFALPATPGTQINVVTYSGSLSLPTTVGDSFDLFNEGLYRNPPVFTDTGSAITMTIPAGTDLVWNGGDVTNPTFWDNAATANWKNGASDDGFYAGDNVLFNDAGLSKTVDLKTMLSPATVTFNNSTGNDYALKGGGGVGFTGPTSVTKNGTGRVAMGGYGHNYTGTVTINAGVLQPDGNWEMLGRSSGIFVNSGGQLNINDGHFGADQRHYDFTIAGTGPDNLGALTNTGGDVYEEAGILNLTLSGDANVGGNNGRFDIGKAGDAFGSIKGNGFTLTKVGTGVVAVRAPASNISYVVNGGVLKVEDFASALGSNPVVVNSGGTLESYGFLDLPATINLGDGSSLRNDGGGAQTWSGPINLTGIAGSNVSIKAAGESIYLKGVISGAGNLTTVDGQGVILNGTASNTLTGSVIANNGQLILAKSGGAVAVNGNLLIANTGNRPIVLMTENNQFGPNSVIQFTGTAECRVELKGTTQTVAGLDYPVATAGFKAIQHSEFGVPLAVDAVSDLIIDVQGANSYTYTADLRDQGGTVNVTKNGTGTQILAGNGIDYRGTTAVNQGLLVGTGDDFWTQTLTIAAGATYEARVTTTPDVEGYEMRCPNSLITGGGTFLKTGTGRMSPTWDGGGSIGMLSGSLIDIQGGEMRLEYGGGTWTANKADLSLATGTSFNMWDNGNAGVFVDSLNGTGSIIRTNYNNTSNFTVGVDNGSGNFAGVISNSTGKINLVKEGSGTQTLGGVNTYTGNTTVNGGTLALGSSGSLKFIVTDSGSNQVSGAGTVSFDGAFDIDISAVTLATGSWTLVNSATKTFNPSFTLGAGWTQASDVWTKTVGSKKYTFTEASGVLSVGPAASYASWIDGFFPGSSDPLIIGADADPDKDGIPNAVEMVLGGNPATGMDAKLLPTIELVTNPIGLPAGDYILFTYRRTDLSVTANVVASSEYDANLVGTWTAAVNGAAGVVIQVDDNYGSFVPPASDTDRVRVFIPRAGNAALFGRLRASVTP